MQPDGYPPLRFGHVRERSLRQSFMARPSPILEAPFLPEENDGYDSGDEYGEAPSCEAVWRSMVVEGAKASDLMQDYPEQVIIGLRDHCIKKLGEIQVPDSLVLSAFGDKVMLVRGSDIRDEPDWKLKWMQLLNKKAENKKPKIGWVEKVTLAAYVVVLEDAAAANSNGLLRPILMKVQAGATPPDILSLPAVEAVVLYKWRLWANRFLWIEFVFYLAWLGAFCVFLNFVKDQPGTTAEYMKDHWLKTSVAMVCNVLSLIFMLPFSLIDGRAMWVYKLEWFNLWNILDLATYTLQVIIFIMYMGTTASAKDWFNVLMAIQCVLLFAKVQYFSRVFSTIKISLVDALKVVLIEVRWYIAFIFLTMLSYGMAFTILYRSDIQNPEGEEFEFRQNFEDTFFSFSTMFGMMMGAFEYEMFFESKHPEINMLFFMVYQTLMAITLLNLLIAVMTEAYSQVMNEEKLLHMTNRAQVIDELEASLPEFVMQKTKPQKFVHFVVVKRERGSFYPEGDMASVRHPSNAATTLREYRSRELEVELQFVTKVDRKLDSVVERMTKLERQVTLDRANSENGGGTSSSPTSPPLDTM